MDAKPINPVTVSAANTVAASSAILSDGVISLRRFHAEDIAPHYAAARESLAELCACMSWCHPAYSLENSTSFILKSHNQWEKGEHFSFAICDVKDGTFLGSVGLSHLNVLHRFANVGYWVRTSRAGLGVATAATRLAAGWAFNELELNRLELVVAANNQPSQRVAEKAGAKREGVLRSRLVLGDKCLDAYMYALVPSDLKA